MDQSPVASTPDPASQMSSGSIPTQAAQPVSVSTNGGSKKAIIIAVVSIVVVAALIGGGYYYFMSQNSPAPTPPVAIPQTTSQVPTATATPSPDLELDAINIDNSSTDFASIDQDLQNL